MSPAQIPGITPSPFSRCEERNHLMNHGKSLTSGQKMDAAIKESIDRALWKDDVLRAIESYEVEVRVKDRVVYLDGHIVSRISQNRIQNAIRAMPGLLGIQNNLILDDKLISEVAASLGTLEHTYGCKFFTGASHGVVTLSGIVSDEDVKLLAEKRVAAHPNVRAVINNVHVSGAEQELQDQPFLQPIIGQTIYFLDGISGVVRQVIINPNNRRVIAMTVRGQFASQRQDLKFLNNGEARTLESLGVVPMEVVRFMTKVSGFLQINSNESKRYMAFDPTRFSAPTNDWKAPFPYCPDDVLFPVEHRPEENQTSQYLPQTPLIVVPKEQLLPEELLANESLSG